LSKRVNPNDPGQSRRDPCYAKWEGDSNNLKSRPALTYKVGDIVAI